LLALRARGFKDLLQSDVDCPRAVPTRLQQE
jgi:hypothetical protein